MNLTCQYQSYSNIYSSMNNILQTFKFIEVKTIRSDFAKFIIILFKYDIANMLIKTTLPKFAAFEHNQKTKLAFYYCYMLKLFKTI